MNNISKQHKRFLGFTLIELMIVVAIVAVLAAVAIPAYTSYIRRSYLSEATSSIAAIKSAEESYFTLNGCYIEAAAHPATVPPGNQGLWNITPMPNGWGNNALAVRPDKYVRFQYEVYATNSINCGSPASDESAVNTALNTCITGGTVGSGDFVDTAFFPLHWYIVVARGDLDGDSTNSTIISAIDDTTTVMCDELE